MVRNHLGKPVTLILENKDFKFFKYGDCPSNKTDASGAPVCCPSPTLELGIGESAELDMSKSFVKNNFDASYVSQLRQQSELLKEEASLRVRVKGEKGPFSIPGIHTKKKMVFCYQNCSDLL